MPKDYSKIVIKINLVELLTFCEVFDFFFKYVKYIHMPNDVKKFTIWTIRNNWFF